MPHLIGSVRVLGYDTMDGTVRNDAVEAIIGATGGHNNQLLLGFCQRTYIGEYREWE
jgi:hypothetical protein